MITHDQKEEILKRAIQLAEDYSTQTNAEHCGTFYQMKQAEEESKNSLELLELYLEDLVA